MAQTTANLVGSVCQPNRNMDTPEAVIAPACEVVARDVEAPTAHRASIPDRELEESTQYHVGTGRPPSISSDLPMTNKDWRSKAKKMHRIVEQIDHEPLGIVVFKWCLILIGSVMLGVVLFLTGEVIYLWSSGDLKRQQNLAMAAFNKTKTNETTNSSSTTDSFLDQ